MRMAPILVAGTGIFDVNVRVAFLERAREHFDLPRVKCGINAELAFLARAVEPGFGHLELFVDIGEDGGLKF